MPPRFNSSLHSAHPPPANPHAPMRTSARFVSCFSPDVLILRRHAVVGRPPPVSMKMTECQTQVWTLASALQYLDAGDLALSVALVCKGWKHASDTCELWAFLLQRDFFPFDLDPTPTDSPPKARYYALLQSLRRPARLIRMQQGQLCSYALATASLRTEENPLFASSARVCLTASGRLVITGGPGDQSRRCVLYCDGRVEELPMMKDRREYHGACVWGASVVVSGGYELKSENCETYGNSCEQLQNGAWRSLAPMAVARAYHTLLVAGSQLLAIAGMNSSGYLDSVERWEYVCWRSLPLTLPEPISDPTAAALSSDLVLIFGGMHEFGFLDSAFELDLSRSCVTAHKLPVEVFTGNNCVTRSGEEFVLFNTLKEIVRIRYRRGEGIVS